MSRTRRGRKSREKRARRRAEEILAALSGRITATEAAKRLGVSRKTYYKWESRALRAVEGALSDREGGRPASPQDAEKESLRKENEELLKKVEVLRQTLELRESLAELLGTRPSGRGRKGRKKGSGAEPGEDPGTDYGTEKKRAEPGR